MVYIAGVWYTCERDGGGYWWLSGCLKRREEIGIAYLRMIEFNKNWDADEGEERQEEFHFYKDSWDQDLAS